MDFSENKKLFATMGGFHDPNLLIEYAGYVKLVAEGEMENGDPNLIIDYCERTMKIKDMWN